MDAFPGAIVAPSAEVGPDRGPGWKVMRQGTPLAPRTVHIQNRIDHFTHVDGSRTPAWLRRGVHCLQIGPFLVPESIRVRLGSSPRVRLASGFLPLPGGNWARSCWLPRIPS